MTGSIKFGAIRDGYVVVTLHFDDPQEQAEVSFVLSFADGTAAEVSKRWPNDFGVTSVDGSRTISLEVPAREKYSPLLEVKTLINGEAGAPSPNYFLYHLYPQDEKELHERFHRSIHRVKDRETLMFCCGQILRESSFDARQKASVSVIYGYCAIDFGEPYMSRAIAFVEDVIAQLRDIPGVWQEPPAEGQWVTKDFRDQRAERFRTHPSGQLISCEQVLWHLHLCCGNHERLVSALEQAMHDVQSYKSFFAFGCYNVCILVVLYGYLLALAGRRKEALACFNWARDFYIISYRLDWGNGPERNGPDNGQFREMGHIHGRISLGLKIGETLASGKVLGLDTKQEMINSIKRVKSGRGSELINDQFVTLGSKIQSGDILIQSVEWRGPFLQ